MVQTSETFCTTNPDIKNPKYNLKKTKVATALGITIVISIFSLPSLHAEDLTAKSELPTLFFTDTDTDPLSGSNWKLTGDGGLFTLNDGNDSTLGNSVISIVGDNGSLNDQSLVVNAVGDISFSNGAVSINRSTSRMGIGTTSPVAKLDVHGDINSIYSGNSSTSLQQLFVMSANNTDSGKKSDAGFVIMNAREGFSYAFRTLEKFTRPGESSEIDGGFAISKQATGAQELVLINPTTNDPTKVELYLSSGASNVNGQWVNASSRDYKENIHELSGEDAMQAMRDLKSVTYQFKRNTDNETMIGFIAEDIPELLATKTRRTVDPLRIVAVLTKAVQEQDKAMMKNKAIITLKNKKITELVKETKTLRERLDKIEALLFKDLK